MDTSRFRLEAIVWSSNPESRFVVINGNILRLGGTMDGLTVTAIERNSVKLRSGDKAGEIRFNLD
ncbi:MAG: general secretion pathway protein GspB [Deltaproteobacteria bacterium]|nr:general secretion pathway protein GspB [Deltaproteobacteria bacterium]